jgi:hydrogenase-4 component F
LSVVGIGVAAIRLLAQRDLKRLVAYMTIIETNWLVFCLVCGSAPFIQLGLYLTAVHSFTTALGFLFVEALSRRFQTRDWTQVSGLYFSSSLLWFFSFLLLLLLVGFPGTPLFFAKVVFLTLLWPYSPLLVVFFSVIFLLLIPLFLFRVWGSMWVGQPSAQPSRFFDLASSEILLFSALVSGALFLGFSPLTFLV